MILYHFLISITNTESIRCDYKILNDNSLIIKTTIQLTLKLDTNANFYETEKCTFEDLENNIQGE